MVGEWKTHPNFGTQFAAVACERFQPAGEGAILRYLSSGAVKGIGPVMAARLVDAFGDQTLEVLENHRATGLSQGNFQGKSPADRFRAS